MGPYGYKWTQAGDEVPHPNLTLTVRRYAQADIDPSQCTFFRKCFYNHARRYNQRVFFWAQSFLLQPAGSGVHGDHS